MNDTSLRFWTLNACAGTFKNGIFNQDNWGSWVLGFLIRDDQSEMTRCFVKYFFGISE
jgi:hypothetical protein